MNIFWFLTTSNKPRLRDPTQVQQIIERYWFDFDFTAEKKFLFTETRQLWFRAEFFNAFNHPQFLVPASTIGANGVGTISATARPARQIQFALKLLF